MANSLLDFVMSLVRDPDAAARYAADPAQALADAHLADVTTADVQNLIPVVSESLSMTAPTHSLDALNFEPVSNVWASGAATAAFDAFDDQLPSPVIVDAQADAPVIVDDLDHGLDVLNSADMVDPLVSLQTADPGFDNPGPIEPAIADDWAQPLDLSDAGDQPSDFDLFD